MNNTALRARAQSANNTHMVFANGEHEKFYFEKQQQEEDNLTVGQAAVTTRR